MNPFGPAGGLRPGTTMRPGSQMMRPGTNRMQVVGVGGSLQQPIAVTAEAPVAREGMRAASRSGVGTSAGPGRQVGDRSYFIGLLRPKIAELSAEMERLAEQEELIEKSSSVLQQLQQKSRALGDEIDKLKATLADVNVAVEHATMQRDVKAIKDEYTRVEQRNRDARKQVDSLFLSVKETEAKTRSDRDTLAQELQKLERRILSENQDYHTYKTTRDAAYALSDAVLDKQHEVRMLAARQDLLMARLARDPDKKRAAVLLRDILRKRREKDELTRQCALSIDEEKALLIAQVKSTRADMDVLERQMNDVRDALQEAKVRLGVLDEEQKNYSSDHVRAYQELQQRDRDLQRFIDDYPDADRGEAGKVAELQQAIVDLLTRISQALELQRQMPSEGSPNALKALTSEVDARRDQLQHDQKTHERLEKELLDRKAELDKVGVLDKKIKDELESHAAKMAQQKAEMVQYSNLDGLREHVEKLRADLVAQKTYLARVRDTGKQLLARLSSAHEAARKRASDDDVFSSLATQEQKLRALWQSAYALDDFVRLKEKETQYRSTKAACLRLVGDANAALKDPSRTLGAFSGGGGSGGAPPPVLNLQPATPIS